ncbi:MAG: hypothetical protein ACX93U_01270 [Salipiger thiooxidans]|uniref:hypothetical protein n=1 Tax=Salipiger thiooxidans TaxID=282683 RepID=UPI001CF9937A|nr:hypothetical protein [Salipiger thiooxidans]
MKLAAPLVLLAGPAMAHSDTAPHVHPHDGALWLGTVALLGVATLGGRMILKRLKAEA